MSVWQYWEINGKTAVLYHQRWYRNTHHDGLHKGPRARYPVLHNHISSAIIIPHGLVLNMHIQQDFFCLALILVHAEFSIWAFDIQWLSLYEEWKENRMPVDGVFWMVLGFYLFYQTIGPYSSSLLFPHFANKLSLSNL